jgi:hypothetical protein
MRLLRLAARPLTWRRSSTVDIHGIAAGVEANENLIPPLHAEQTREESLLIVPTDPTLPTYSGHSTAHVTNPDDSSNFGGTNTVTLHGSDGSNLISRENIHVLARRTGSTWSSTT